MLIRRSELFKSQFQIILNYIASDKISAMLKFRKDLNIQIKDISSFPYKYKKSNYHNDENVREMTFRGYTIIYKIYDNYIQILEIFNQNLPILKKVQSPL